MKNKHLHNIEKTGYKAPDNYFDSFDERLLKSLDANKRMSTIKISGHTIPDQYLENLDDQILSKVSNNDKPKVVQFISWRKMAYTSAVAASLILMFSLIFNTSEDITFDSIETSSIENYLSEGNFTSYELASLLTEDELNANGFTDTTISESSIEDYLLENASLEDLIIE